MDSLRSTREAPGRQERTNWTAREAPGRQERTNWTACEARLKVFEVRAKTNVGSNWAPQLKGQVFEVRRYTTVMNRVIIIRRMQQPAARG